MHPLHFVKTSLALALFAVVVVDELASGVLPATAGDVARDLAVPAGLAAGGIITAFHVLAIFVEMPLLAWSEREESGPRHER